MLRTVENYADVVIPRLPRIFQEFTEAFLEDGDQSVAQPIERRPQRPAPLLVPGMAPGIAAAIGAPALDSVDTTPRTLFDDFGGMLGGMHLEKFAIVCKLRKFGFLNVVQGRTECHFAVMVMVSVALAVGRDVDQLRALALI